MAVTQNTYTGNGSTTNYSFTFPYLETTDIKVSLNGTVTTAYTLANATTVQFNTAPANGAAIRIYRETDDSSLQATFYPGSAIRSSDLNDNFTQNLYVTQEANNVSAAATTTANTALTNSNTAISTANSAVSTANTASSNASAAVSTANTASSNASAAVSTANTASTNASAAVSTANAATATANSAAADAATAIATANSAVSTANAATATANTASTNASTAVSTANAASTAANNAVTTANSAVTTAGNAVTTANSAVSTANSATSTANTALSTANAAASAVANAILYDTVANVAAIPASPANNDAVEVVDSTGIESFTPLSGVPTGFVGDSGLSVRLVYTTTGSTWTWIQYFPNDPELRYGDAITTLQTDLTAAEGDITTLQGDVSTLQGDVTGLQGDITTLQGDVTTLQSDVLGLDTNKLALAGGTMTGALTLAADPTTNLQAATKQYVDTGLSGISADKITEGNTSAEVIDTGSDGRFVVTTEGSERLRVTSGGLVGIGTSVPDCNLHVDSSTDGVIARIKNTAGLGARLAFESASIVNTSIGTPTGGGAALAFYVAGAATERARIDSSGRLLVGTSSSSGNFLLEVNGAIKDQAGPLRSAPQNTQTTAYTLVASDTGKHISTSSGGVTVPSGVFNAGDIIAIYNNSSSPTTIAQGSGVTLRQAGTANTGNRTLAQYGLASVMCVGSNTFTISGSGLS